MRGGTETRHNAHRLANVLDDIEREYQDKGDYYKIDILSNVLNYYQPQMLDDMHDLLAYIYELERKLEEK